MKAVWGDFNRLGRMNSQLPSKTRNLFVTESLDKMVRGAHPIDSPILATVGWAKQRAAQPTNLFIALIIIGRFKYLV